MKQLFLILLAISVLSSCDKIKHPYPAGIATDMDTTLYSGSWGTYPWPTFNDGFGSKRNIVIEDYTGHKCIYCPAAAVVAEEIEKNNPDRVYVISVHTSPGGIGPFQETDNNYIDDLTNDAALAYGDEFKSGFGFAANPAGTISRVTWGTDMFVQSGSWNNYVMQLISENSLKANIVATSNYFEETRGLFVHALIDPLSTNPDDIKVVTQFIENSYVGKQKFPDGEHKDDYNFHNTLRGTLDGLPFGQSLSSKEPDDKGYYQFDYSFKIPEKYDPENCHVIVYLMNKSTYEIIQAVKVEIKS